MRFIARFASVLIVLLMAMTASAQASQGEREPGLSVREFRNLALSLPALPGRIQAMQLFFPGYAATGVAISAYSERTGWQIFVFDHSRGKAFRLSWKSGRLGSDFTVSWSGALRTLSLGSEDGVVFTGCAPHVCPDVFAILLYVPSKHAAFTAKYVWGKVTYTPAVSLPENRDYKAALEQLVKNRRHQ